MAHVMSGERDLCDPSEHQCCGYSQGGYQQQETDSKNRLRVPVIAHGPVCTDFLKEDLRARARPIHGWRAVSRLAATEVTAE